MTQKTFTPDARYMPHWPPLPWPRSCAYGPRPVYREHALKTPEAEAFAMRIEAAWSCPHLTGPERRTLLRAARKLWHALPAGDEWTALAAAIDKCLSKVEAQHGTPEPMGAIDATT